MSMEDEIKEQIEEFFETTCISDYTFKQVDPNVLLKMKKKTPIGRYQIKSVELVYFIDPEDHVIIGILSEGNDEIYQIIKQNLINHLK